MQEKTILKFMCERENARKLVGLVLGTLALSLAGLFLHLLSQRHKNQTKIKQSYVVGDVCVALTRLFCIRVLLSVSSLFLLSHSTTHKLFINIKPTKTSRVRLLELFVQRVQLALLLGQPTFQLDHARLTLLNSFACS